MSFTPLLLVLLLIGSAVYQASSATNQTTNSTTNTSNTTLTVHVLETYSPFGTKYQVGNYSAPAEEDSQTTKWTLVLSFKALPMTSLNSFCWEVVSAESGLNAPGTQVWQRINTSEANSTRRAQESVFCIPETNSTTFRAPIKVSYSDSPTRAVSVVSLREPSKSVRHVGWSLPRIDFFPLEAKQWQPFVEFTLVKALLIIQNQAAFPADPCYDNRGKLRPGNFNANYPGDPRSVLCVTYAQVSTHDYWTQDNHNKYVTDIQLVEQKREGGGDPAKACSNGFSPVFNQLLAIAGDERIAKLALSSQKYYVVCYATSQLVRDGERVSSKEFLQSIAFDERRPREDRVLTSYNIEGLERWQEVNVTEQQVNAW